MQKIWIYRIVITIILIILNILGIILSFYLFPYTFLISGSITIIIIIIDRLFEPKIMEMQSKQEVKYKSTMTKDKIIEILEKSHPKEWSYNDSEGLYTYINDVNLTIRLRDEVQGNGDSFYEDWVEKFPNPEAEKIIVRIFYGSSFIEDYLFVFVDGYRNILPPPIKYNDLRISTFQYNLGRILDCNHPFYKDDNLRDYDFKLKIIANFQVDSNL